MILFKIVLLITNIECILTYTRISPILYFNNTISCNSKIYSTNFSQDCGISIINSTINGNNLNNRLINGENAKQLSWPWLVYLAEEQLNRKIVFKCSGSLIHSQFILTTTSCINTVNQTRLIAIIGSAEIKNTSQTNTIYYVSQIFNYKDFNPNNKFFSPNLALIKLTRPVNSTTVKPICLPNSNDGSAIFGKFVAVVSWGASFDNLTYTEFPSVPQQTIFNVLDDFKQKCSDYEYSKRLFYCATDFNGKSYSCFGDEGSPMMFYDRSTEKWYIYGILTYFKTDSNSCVPSSYILFSKLTYFLSWLGNILS